MAGVRKLQQKQHFGINKDLPEPVYKMLLNTETKYTILSRPVALSAV